MPAIGRISYSIYLWHWPLIVIGRIRAVAFGYPELAGAVIGGGLSLALAAAAYAAVERPLRHRGTGRSRRLAIIAAMFVATLSAALAVARPKPIADPEGRFNPAEPVNENETAVGRV